MAREHGQGSLGYQPQLHQIGSAIGAYYTGQYLAGAAGLGSSGSGAASAPSGAPTGSDLGIFSNGGTGGMASVGGGNAGALANAGGIAGGISGGAGATGALSAGAAGYGTQAGGLLGQLYGGSHGGSQQQPLQAPSYSPVPSGMMGSQMPQGSMPSPVVGLNTDLPPYLALPGYRARDFYGATVWS